MEINYKDVMNLGFKRQDVVDTVFFDQNGYNYFIVNKKLMTGLNEDTIELDWDSNTKEVVMCRYDKDANRLSEMDILSLTQLKEIVAFFDNKHALSNYVDCITTAC